MNAVTKAILVVALVAAGAVILHDVGASGIVGRSGAAEDPFGWYWVIMLVDVCLGTVVAWMLFGKR